MLKLSKKTEYAVIAILDMAAGGEHDLTTAKDLAAKYNIPRELLGKVLQSLVREEIIVSQQGVKGGYRLNHPLESINFNTVIRAVEGPIHLVDCRDEHACNCEQLDYCNIKSPMEFIQLELNRFFTGITLADFKNRYSGLVPLVQIQSTGPAAL